MTMNEKTMVVKTLRNRADAPETAEINTPFEIGQVIDLEYDLPDKQVRTAYSGYAILPGGKALGSFEVTDIVLNTLVNPNFTMIEVQSRDEKFDALYPDSKTMLIDEGVIMKRLKNRGVLLSEEKASQTMPTQDYPDKIENDIPAIIESFAPGQRFLETDTQKTIELTRQTEHGIWIFKVYDSNDNHLYDTSATETRLAKDIAAGYVVSKAEIRKKKSLDEKIREASSRVEKESTGSEERQKEASLELS